MRTILILAMLVAAPVLAGCMDDESPVDASTATDLNGTKKTGLGNLTSVGNGTIDVGNASSDGHLPHVHDYWGARDRILLADEVVSLQPWMSFNWILGRRDASVGGAWWELPQGKTIYQGTGKMEITLDWQDATIASLAVAYRSAAGPEWSEWVPVTKGSPLVVDVKPEMTDLPHSGGSRWAFLFKPANAPGPAVGDVRIKLEIVRVGDLHAFPAHQDFYADAESLVLMDAETQSVSRSWTSQILGFAQGQQGDEEGFTLPEGSIVPPGTDTLIVDITVKDAVARDVYFSYRDASGNWDRGEPIESPEPGVFRFVLPVAPEGVDSYYAKQSNWRFFVHVTGSGGSNSGLPFNCGGCADTTTKLHARVEAFDDSPFESEEERSRRASASSSNVDGATRQLSLR